MSGVTFSPEAVPLRAYLAAHVQQRGFRIFENEIDALVKQSMKAAYPTDPTDLCVTAMAGRTAAAATAAADAMRIRINELPPTTQARETAATAAAVAGADPTATKKALQMAERDLDLK